MSRDQNYRRARLAVAIVPLIVLVVLHAIFDKLHDCAFYFFRLTDRATDSIFNWIAGEGMSK